MSRIIILYFCLIIYFVSEIKAQMDFKVKSISTNYKPIPIPKNNDTINVVSSNSNISIELEPFKGDSINYTYQLVPFEKDWTTVSFPIVRYMNLEKGNQLLTIKALSKNKEIGNYKLTIIVNESISEVWWFYPILIFYGILLIVGGFYLFFLYSFRQKMKVQVIRNQIASDLHDEIGSTLSSIAMSANFINNKIINQPSDIQQILNQISSDSENTVNTIRDTVWALNPNNDSFETLIEKIRSFAYSMLSTNGIKLNFENKIEKYKEISLNIDQRKNLYLIAKEVINNIGKHSLATYSKINIEKKADWIIVVIEDNGKGFDLTQNTNGNGLKNIQNRADESLFLLNISSTIDFGTKIKLEVQII